MGKIINDKEPEFVGIAKKILDHSGNAPVYTISVSEQATINKYLMWCIKNETPEVSSYPADDRKKLTRMEVANIFRISLPTLDRYVRLGLIEANKIGTRILFNYSAVENAARKIETAKHQRLC